MSIKDIFIAQGHTEPLGQLDRWDGRTEPPTEGIYDEDAVEVGTPKGGVR